MQKKTITLSRDTVLWEAGDVARGIAILEKGRLGARTERGLMGVMLANMVLGDSALLSGATPRDRAAISPDQASPIHSGSPYEHRTATIFAIDDDTVVTEYPVSEVRADFESGSEDLMKHIIVNQVAQICRNMLMVIATKRGQALVDEPLGGLVRGLLADVPRITPIRTWDNALLTCRLLQDLRNLSDRLLDQMGPKPNERVEMIVNASQSLTQLSIGKDVLPIVEAFIEAERQKTEWWAKGGVA
jgi:CRP-like cAMP-binding protein